MFIPATTVAGAVFVIATSAPTGNAGIVVLIVAVLLAGFGSARQFDVVTVAVFVYMPAGAAAFACAVIVTVAPVGNDVTHWPEAPMIPRLQVRVAVPVPEQLPLVDETLTAVNPAGS